MPNKPEASDEVASVSRSIEALIQVRLWTTTSWMTGAATKSRSGTRLPQGSPDFRDLRRRRTSGTEGCRQASA